MPNQPRKGSKAQQSTQPPSLSQAGRSGSINSSSTGMGASNSVGSGRSVQLHGGSSNNSGGGASASAQQSVALGAVGKDGTLVLADRVAGCLQLLQVGCCVCLSFDQSPSWTYLKSSRLMPVHFFLSFNLNLLVIDHRSSPWCNKATPCSWRRATATPSTRPWRAACLGSCRYGKGAQLCSLHVASPHPKMLIDLEYAFLVCYSMIKVGTPCTKHRAC